MTSPFEPLEPVPPAHLVGPLTVAQFKQLEHTAQTSAPSLV
jgi:hypothetical protein